jgi:hypothetical protein
VPTLIDNGTVSIASSLDVSTAIDPTSTGLVQLGAGATLDVAAATGSGMQIKFQDSSSELIVDSAALFGTNVGTASYAGPQLQQYVPGDKIDLKNFSLAGVTFGFNASTGVLQVSNSANQVADFEFQTSSLGGTNFAATSDGAGGIIITDPPSAPAATAVAGMITVTDPPVIMPNPGQPVGSTTVATQGFGSLGHAIAGTAVPATYASLAALLNQYMAAGSSGDLSSFSRTAWTPTAQPGFGDAEFLARPHQTASLA